MKLKCLLCDEIIDIKEAFETAKRYQKIMTVLKAGAPHSLISFAAGQMVGHLVTCHENFFYTWLQNYFEVEK